MPPQNPSVPQPEEEPEELARFREEWKAELQRRRQQSNSSDSTLQSQASAAAANNQGLAELIFAPSPAKQQAPIPPIHFQTTKTVAPDHPVVTGAADSTYVSPGLGTALAAYRQAVQHEQHGDLDEALVLYRQAFRLDPNVDRAYHREEMINSVRQAQQGGLTANKLKVVLATSGEMDQLAAAMQQSLSIKTTTPGKLVVTGTLANTVANFPEDMKFDPENELEPVPLNKLPEELFVIILRKLDPASVEKFARVSRKARFLTLDNAIWRDFVTRTYIPPQIGAIEEMVPVIRNHLGNYRRVYIEHPRVRLDGVYIAICHYVRHGLSENSWVNITHLITYHRYMRFFSNGQVLSLLANEEFNPQQVIPLLKPTLRMKGLLIGNWYLDGTTVYLTNLIDASGKFHIPLPGNEASTYLDRSGSTLVATSRYVFAMSLNLRSRPVGRWNRMDMQTYDSVNVETGDTVPVALKHDRPYWFSKVRSYERGLM
ncbi:hypothetical protein BDQ17DRAFT_1303663 [Cyathus striatus]|nr:hypothetical protein BDQ17DRAFT_1303663 [Cyathus striatus]